MENMVEGEVELECMLAPEWVVLFCPDPDVVRSIQCANPDAVANYSVAVGQFMILLPRELDIELVFPVSELRVAEAVFCRCRGLEPMLISQIMRSESRVFVFLSRGV